MKFPACLLGIVVLAGCGGRATVSEETPTASGAPPMATATVAPVAAAPVAAATPVAPVGTPAPPAGTAGPAVGSGDKSPLTTAEAEYVEHFMKVGELIKSAENRIKNEPRAATTITLSSADIEAASRLHASNFSVPARFTIADSYLTSGLRSERTALLKLKFNIMDAAGEADYLAAGELIKKAATEMLNNIPPSQNATP